MKNNLKNLTIKVVLFFTLLFYFNSCEKNENEHLIENSNEVQKIISRKTSLEDISNFTEVNKILNKINSKLNEKLSLKKSPINLNGVKIVTDDILHMKYAETHTYTFKIVREKPLHFIENIVLHYNVDKKSYDEYLIQYNLSSKEYQDVLNGFPIDENAKVDIYELESGTLLSLSNKGGCYRVCQTISVNCTAGGDHSYGEACSGSPDQQPYQYQSCGSFCLDDNPAIVTEEPDPNTSGGGGGSTNPNGVIVTNPNTASCDSSSTGIVGDIDGNGCSVTTEDIARNTLFDRLSTYLTSQQQADWIGLYADLSVVEILNEFLDESSFTNKNQYHEFTNDLIITIMSDLKTDINALQFTLEAFKQNKINNPLDFTFLNSIDQFINLDIATIDPNLAFQIQLYFTTKCAVLRFNHPDWSDIKIYWEASKDFVHIALDGFGMIPVVGEIADLTNGILYLIEGDGVNATLSFAATIPIVGWGATTGKYVFKITASTLGTKVKLTWKVISDGIVYFGSTGNQLRKVLGITDSALQAHHLMPWALRNNDVIQKAAKSGSAFHMNEALNGIAVVSWRNQPNHNTYNNLIESKLNAFNNLNPNASVDDAYNFVSDLIADVRDWVINNPNSHLNDLVLP